MTTVALGLDGAGFELLQPWLDAGKLPALSRIVEDGVAADMESCLPPVTCPNWKCYATGRNPGKLGVFWWERVDRSNRTITTTSAAHNFDGTNYWEYMDGPVASLNLPTSFPPHEVNGVHVAGGPGADQTGYTAPASFEAELEAEYDYRVHPEQLSLLQGDDPENACVEEIYDLVDTRFDVLCDLVSSGEYEFVHLSVFYINMLQHFYYDHPVVEEAWTRIDDRIADLRSLDELDHLVLLSDHGSNRVERWFRVNAWLAREGYLVTESGASDWLYRAGLTKQRIRRVLNVLRVEWWARRVVPERLQSLLPTDDGVVKKAAKAGVVDWERSTAIASGQGPIYVLEPDPEDRRRVRDELVEALDGLTDDHGTPIVRAALPAESVYSGPYVADGPDVVLDQAPHVHIDGGIGVDTVFDTPQDWQGENTKTGLFAACGPAIDGATEPDDVHILDLAPTVLHLLGYPVREDMDGEVLTGVFEADSEPATRSVETVPGSATHGTGRGDVSEDATDRLADLGYL
ncbi:alkaline phosphatase family protein [Haloarcula pellucida]|uniref:Nucleotide pyrophosphatase n=1 Tax=Haloarcula pellucida TaxID=1427151 RepID=A0A830GKK9_9EURY|nr:alkaline phosphatase family protein [Halomicroarcula pellucida]MBX0348700.1 alkaline phosphatase family protein [Halomicroarcula pellucida]GGN92155.1 nucleotide pyrophosphatase [Halomicroarcula pellucida]